MRAIQVHGFPDPETTLQEVSCLAAEKGQVSVDVQWSSLNYKDMLAITGRGKIMRDYPLIAGIDCAGTVTQHSGDFAVGARVVCVGAGLGETHNGGLAEKAALPQAGVVRLPTGWDGKMAMLCGTAGFSAALAVRRLQQHGLTPESGEIAVTGANGGVGLWAVKLLAYLGYDVVAVVRELECSENLLLSVGAARLLNSAELVANQKPLCKAQFAGAIDNVGGECLSALLAQIQPHGAVASIGNAGSVTLNTTVMPFILRGVALYGISSSNCLPVQRQQTWDWLGQFDADFVFAQPYHVLHLDEVIAACQEWANRPLGRYIVNCQE